VLNCGVLRTAKQSGAG